VTAVQRLGLFGCALLCVAEYILWGDQNEPRIFDFFLENNILTYLHKVLLQPSNRSGEVAKQVGTWRHTSQQHSFLPLAAGRRLLELVGYIEVLSKQSAD
jgi:hypothetical protein